MKQWLFWIVWGIDALICAITAVFFLLGIADGSVSSFNIGLWIAIWAVLGVILGGGFGLKRLGYPVLGTLLLLVLAIPGLLSGLFLFLFVVTGSTWN